MPNGFAISGIVYALTRYVASRDIISLSDLISFLKSDACLKIGYMVFNLDCGLYFYSGVKGRGHDNSEFAQLYRVSDHRNNMLEYIKYANRFFFIKEEVGDIIKKEPWITFNREGITPETRNFPPQREAHFAIKQTAFLLSGYNLRYKDNIKHEFNMWCSGYSYALIDEINSDCSSIEDMVNNDVTILNLTEYIPSMSGHIDYFEEARRYAKNNIPSTDLDEIKLMHNIREKYKLSNSKIASIVFEREWSDTTSDSLTKRVQRGLMKYGKLTSS